MGQLTDAQRYTISAMNKTGHTQTAIGIAIDRDKSVVSRELKRNCDQRSGEYRHDLAIRKCADRHKHKSKKQRFTQAMASTICDKLAQKYSPEQIAGEAKRDGVEMVSTERIYQYIWSDKKQQGILHKHLRTRGKRYRKRGCSKDKRGVIKDRISIDERPEVVASKERLGDLEIDTIIGKDHKGAILTINDRASGMVKIRKLMGKDATELANMTIEALQDWQAVIKTITADNGKEFAEHKMISEALNIDFFFAHPYHSWERGANENLNGLIRQYIPKKTDFSTISEEYIQFIEEQLNNRPRKRFGFQSPIHIFKQKKVAFIT